MLHLFAAIKATVVHFCDLKPARAKHFTRRNDIQNIWSNHLQLAILSEKINYMMRTPFYSFSWIRTENPVSIYKSHAFVALYNKCVVLGAELEWCVCACDLNGHKSRKCSVNIFCVEIARPHKKQARNETVHSFVLISR